MKRDAAEILKEALALPVETRAALAGSLLDSLDAHVDEDAEAAWATEVNRRVAELDSGAVKTIPWADVRRRLAARGCPSSRSNFIRSLPTKRRLSSKGDRERNEVASARFQRELDGAVDLISERPNTGSPYLGNTRHQTVQHRVEVALLESLLRVVAAASRFSWAEAFNRRLSVKPSDHSTLHPFSMYSGWRISTSANVPWMACEAHAVRDNRPSQQRACRQIANASAAASWSETART